MSESVPFAARRVARTCVQKYGARPAVVFPLHDYLEEKRWAVGWEPEVVYDPGGAAREGAVFRVRRGGIEEIWVLTNWDPDAGCVGYVHITPGREVTHLRIHVTGPEAGPTTVNITYTWTALSAAGNAFVDQRTEDDFEKSMREWEEEMAHYLRTGGKLERA